jgi:hypothetical protein
MSHLHRHLAPISVEAWAQIDEEAKQTLKTTLAARKLVDFSGPKGWQSPHRVTASPPRSVGSCRSRNCARFSNCHARSSTRSIAARTTRISIR